jgi:hypothetical protein
VSKGISNCKLQIANCKMVFAILVLLANFPAGCTSSKTETPEAPVVARSVVERGPVKVTAEVAPAQARLSDEPVLTLSIEAASGVKVEKPLFGDRLGAFKILDCRQPLAKTHEGREVAQMVFRLEPTAVGRHVIDPIDVRFTDPRPGGDKKTQTVETKPLTVRVTSVRGEETPKLGDLRGAAGPIGLPWLMPIWAWVALGVGIPAAGVAVWWYRRRRIEKAVAALILTPEELARRELKQLAQSGLAERDIKQFYVELTGIIRRFIERTSGIHAPEQTTEEFLREIHHARIYPQEVNGRLKDFLESADLVKFAAFQPRQEDIDESFRRAERFVDLPSPIGRGTQRVPGGEGSTEGDEISKGLGSTSSPHPNPLPKGEGTDDEPHSVQKEVPA